MARTYPRPSQYTGVERDGGIVRTFDGHLGINVNTDPEMASNEGNWRANRRDDFSAADIGMYGREDDDEGGY